MRIHKPKRLFLKFFLAVQLLFIVWIIGGVAGTDPQTEAGQAGAAIGAMLIVALWVAVDFILGVSYGIYKLAKRS